MSLVVHRSVIVLTTERFLLRHFAPEDLEPLAALYQDPEIRKYFPEGTLSPEDTRRELEWFIHGHPEQPRLGLWATVDRSSGEFVGRCGLLPWTIDGRGEVELAFLIDKRHWGKGYATEAASGIVRYAKEELGLARLICLILPGNSASARVAAKVGMAYERAIHDELGPCELWARHLD